MNLKEQKEGFYRRWNIVSKESDEELFRKFKQGILTSFQNVESQLTDKSITRFCIYFGIQEEHKYYNGKRIDKNIVNYIKKINNLFKLCEIIGVILSLRFKEHNRMYKTTNYRQEVEEFIREAVEISGVDVSVTKNKQGNIILYPKGEKKLDDELVNKVLSFLDQKSNKHFEEALKLYQDKKTVKSAESLRRTLEEFLRYKLKNEKGLTKNIEALQKTLENNVKTEIRNIIFQTFKNLDKYFNEYSKHKDGNINEAENEFLIYQTGLLCRYINHSLEIPKS